MDWPAVQHFGGLMSPSTSNMTLLTLSAGGGYQTLFASLPRKISGLIVQVIESSSGTANLDFLIDIGEGPNPNEVILVPSILYTGISGTQGGATFYFPVKVASGRRLSARSNSSSGAGSITIVVHTLSCSWDFHSGSRIVAIGDDIGGVGGTAVNVGVNNNKHSTWSELTASTLFPISGLCFAMGNQADSSLGGVSGIRYLLDVAIGPSGSEQIIIPDVCLTTSGNEQHPIYSSPWLPIPISAGTRVVARMASDISASPDPWDIIIYGVVT